MNTILIIVIIISSSHLLMTTIPTPAFSAATNDTTGDRYIATDCLPTLGSYTPGSNYSQSLSYLVDDLCANAPKRNGSRIASWAEDPTNWAHGLALCRGDVSMNDCKTCLINATIQVVNTDCLYIKAAIIWHDHCMLKYSDIPFFGQIDNDNRFDTYLDYHASLAWNGTFTNKTRDLLNRLVDDVAINTAVPLFAHGNNTYGSETVYGMVQCTRDLNLDNCRTCLGVIVKDLLYPRPPQKGARALSGSCMTRYEIYPFLK